MIQWLKFVFAREEIEALNRYRVACGLVDRWMAMDQDIVETSAWIRDVGEDRRGTDIAKLRGRLHSLRALQGMRS